MTVLVIIVVLLALVAGFAWGRGTAGGEVEAGHAENAVEAERLQRWAENLTAREVVTGWIETHLEHLEAEADRFETTYTCHAAKELYDQATEADPDVPTDAGYSNAPSGPRPAASSVGSNLTSTRPAGDTRRGSVPSSDANSHGGAA